MSAALWDRPFRVVADVLSLDADVFRALSTDPGAWFVGAVVVLVAGLSEAVGQSVVLFANRVRPRRFIASLLLTALSYPVGLLFTLSTVFLADRFFGQELAVRQVLLIALWSFAPHLFGALILTPYAGGFIALCLSAWSFAVMTAGIGAVAARRHQLPERDGHADRVAGGVRRAATNRRQRGPSFVRRPLDKVVSGLRLRAGQGATNQASNTRQHMRVNAHPSNV